MEIRKITEETKEEYLLFGYNKALENIFEVYRYQSLSESFIKDLHYFLYESLTPDFGGKYKTEQNYIREFDKNGNLLRTVFIPSKPQDVDNLMGNLVYQFNECVKDVECNTIIAIFKHFSCNVKIKFFIKNINTMIINVTRSI